jgi:hypothetical protein
MFVSQRANPLLRPLLPQHFSSPLIEGNSPSFSLTESGFFSTLAIFLWESSLASAKNLHANLIKR